MYVCDLILWGGSRVQLPIPSFGGLADTSRAHRLDRGGKQGSKKGLFT